MVPAAQAGDWSASVTATERLSVNDNPPLDPDPDGGAIGALSSIRLNVTTRTRSAKVDFEGDFGYQKYWGWNGYEGTEGFTPRLSAGFEKYGKTTSFKANASYVRDFASDSDLAETEVASGKSSRQTFKANAGLTKNLDQRNSVTLSARNTTISYIDSDPGDTPSTSLGTSLSWLHRATRRIDFNTSAGVDWTAYDNIANSENYLFFLRSDVTVRASQRLKYNLGTGVQYLDASRDLVMIIGTPRRHEGTLGWTANAGFDYLLRDLTLSGSASYGLSPTVDGDITKSLTAVVSANYKINDVSSLGLSARVYMADTDDSSGFDESSFSIGPTYSRDLTRLWRMQASYSFVIADDDDGTAYQNAAFLSFSRKFDILP